MDLGWKLASAGAMAGAAFVASKVAEGGWKAVTGHDAPHEDDDDVQRLSGPLESVSAFANRG